MVRAIPLRSSDRPREALVDDADYEALASYQWRYYNNGWTGYAVRVDNPAVKMHRVIADAPAGMPVHHENGNGIDNRRENLAVLSLSEHRRRHGRQYQERHAHGGRRMACEWEWLLLRKFPALDVRWSPAVQARWWQSFDRLMAVVAHQAALPKPSATLPSARGE